MRRLTLGTAGHIDHGKTTLVRALTGVDTDRLPDEKRRGITIDLGFAVLPLGDGLELDVVDVPGHEGFIRNMLAGATGIDMALLVVAADEGVMPQTREHLAILNLLGVGHGVVALTRADLAEAEWLELVREEVAELLAGGGLAEAPILAVSATTGAGLDGLRAALANVARQVRARGDDDLVRLPIDRVFTVKGTGTVVTGTLWSGHLGREDRVRIEPGGITARVRALQRHGAAVDAIRAGERGAVALTGVDRHQLRRGDTIVTDPAWEPSALLTVQVQLLADAAGPLTARQRVRVHLGTSEVLARLALADESVRPGDFGLAQLRLEEPLLARAGDRLVIRSYSPVTTIGGATVLEPAPPRRKRWPEPLRHTLPALADPATAGAALFRLHGVAGVPADALRVWMPPATSPPAALPAGVMTVGSRLVLRSSIDAMAGRLLAAVDAFHLREPIAEGLDRERLRQETVDSAAGRRRDRDRQDTMAVLFDHCLHTLVADGAVRLQGSMVARTDHQPRPDPDEALLLPQVTAAFAAAGLQFIGPDELPPTLASHPRIGYIIRFMERSGTLVRLAPDRWVDAAALSGAVSAIRTQMSVNTGHAVGDFRDLLQLTRKHLLPLLEYLDSTGVTRRDGDLRLVLAEPPQETAGSAAAGESSGRARSNGPDDAVTES